MKKHDIEADPELSAEHIEIISGLSDIDIADIDKHLLSFTNENWRKIAMVVGSALMESQKKYKGVPDLYYAQRVRKMISDGVLESQGFIENMRYSEVRRVK